MQILLEMINRAVPWNTDFCLSISTIKLVGMYDVTDYMKLHIFSPSSYTIMAVYLHYEHDYKVNSLMELLNTNSLEI